VDNSEAPAVCPLFQRVDGPFYSSGRSVGVLRWWEPDTTTPLGATTPMIHHHLSWMALMLSPWSVVSWYPGSVLLDSMFSRCGHIYSKSCDAPPLIGNAPDCFGVAVGCMQKWARGSKFFLSHPLDQTDITMVNPLHAKCVSGSRDWRDADRGRVQGWPHHQGRPHLLVRPHLPNVVR
jgi:hypothetical protein